MVCDGSKGQNLPLHLPDCRHWLPSRRGGQPRWLPRSSRGARSWRSRRSVRRRSASSRSGTAPSSRRWLRSTAKRSVHSRRRLRRSRRRRTQRGGSRCGRFLSAGKCRAQAALPLVLHHGLAPPFGCHHFQILPWTKLPTSPPLALLQAAAEAAANRQRVELRRQRDTERAGAALEAAAAAQQTEARRAAALDRLRAKVRSLLRLSSCLTALQRGALLARALCLPSVKWVLLLPQAGSWLALKRPEAFCRRWPRPPSATPSAPWPPPPPAAQRGRGGRALPPPSAPCLATPRMMCSRCAEGP